MPANATYRVTVAPVQGNPATGFYTDDQARSTIARGLRLGCRAEIIKGDGIVMTREPTRRWPGGPAHTVTLVPIAGGGGVTGPMRRELAAISSEPGACYLPESGRIRSSFLTEATRATTRALIARGLVVVDPDTNDVTLSLRARLLMIADRHRTETSQPTGYLYDAFGCRRSNKRGTLMRDPSSWARCSCDWFAAGYDRDDARWKARQHREEALTPLLREQFGTGRGPTSR